MNRESIIKYFKSCYQSDTRSFILNNFFGSKIEFDQILEGEDELLNGHINRYPLDDEFGVELNKNLTLYEKEKTLYLFSFFITGSDLGILDKRSKLCAPLFIHPANLIVDNGFHYLEPDFDKTFLNINFITKLVDKNQEEFFQELSGCLIHGQVNFGGIGKLKRVLERFIGDFDGEELLHYPSLCSLKTIKDSISLKKLRTQVGFKIFPVVAMGLLKKSEQTRGVINELNLLIDQEDDHSNLLKGIFSNVWDETSLINESIKAEVLSPAQQEVVRSANSNSLTQVTGPPGTGKSYTIAALAVDNMAAGRSTLIVGKTDEAVEVVRNKISNVFGLEDVIMQSGDIELRVQLRNFIIDRLYSIKSVANFEEGKEELYTIKKEFHLIVNEVNQIAKELSLQLYKEMKIGEFLGSKRNSRNIFDAIKKKYLKSRQSSKTPYWLLTSEFFQLLDQLEELYKKYVLVTHFQHQRKSIAANRKNYSRFQDGLTTKSETRRADLFKLVNFKVIFESIPIWLTKASAVSGLLPMEKEMFDLVIIDEASQCDIATMIPVFQRAKRAVVVGDPKQLRHVSFLSTAYQNELLRKYNLPNEEFESMFNYRNLSILDLVNRKIPNDSQVIFLNEHYRSNPDIINFSNQEFYNGSLKIMTDHPERSQVTSTYYVQTNGFRDSKGVNEKEAKNLIGKVKLLIAQIESNKESLVHSIGILSPFRAQVDFLNKLIINSFSIAQIKKYNLLCGTAYSFQGEERDVMFLSMCLDRESNPTAFYHLNKPDVFNVSITRAKHRQYVFLSVTEKDLKDSVFRDFILQNRQPIKQLDTEQIKDLFVTEVGDVLKENQIDYEVDYSIAGSKVDLMCYTGNLYFGINLIGYPGEFEAGHSVDEMKLLNRSGVRVFPMPYSFWHFDKERSSNELLSFIKALG